jgi:hypothetical protein
MGSARLNVTLADTVGKDTLTEFHVEQTHTVEVSPPPPIIIMMYDDSDYSHHSCC